MYSDSESLESYALRCCCRCCCSCGCTCCSGCHVSVAREMEDNVQCVAFFSPRCPLVPFLPFSPCDLFGLARFSRCSRGCSSRSSTASRRPQMWAVVHTDPPSRFATMSCVCSTHRSLHVFEFPFLASMHFSCVVTSFTSSCPSWASTSLSSSPRSS